MDVDEDGEPARAQVLLRSFKEPSERVVIRLQAGQASPVHADQRPMGPVAPGYRVRF